MSNGGFSSDTCIHVHMCCQTTTNKIAITSAWRGHYTMGQILKWWSTENGLNPHTVFMQHNGVQVNMSDTLGQLAKEVKNETVYVTVMPADGRLSLMFRQEDFLDSSNQEKTTVHGECS